MRSAHISRRQVEAMYEGLDDDFDVFAVQEDEIMRTERAEVDRYVEETERLLAQEQRESQYRLGRFNDASRLRRAHRRADRSVLRLMPARLGMADLIDGEAA
jgi:hypothetical protein